MRARNVSAPAIAAPSPYQAYSFCMRDHFPLTSAGHVQATISEMNQTCKRKERSESGRQGRQGRQGKDAGAREEGVGRWANVAVADAAVGGEDDDGRKLALERAVQKVGGH
eukprot:SM000078S22057  [mRNA]  locus=s78:185095:185602:- [translate_table: standard]